jgi:DNA-binding response OmpR family regulator
MDGYVAKPIRLAELSQAIAQLVRHGDSPPAAPPAPRDECIDW